MSIFSLFNWKKHPANVFYVAIPLFLLGMSLCGSYAFLEWKFYHDMVYTYIVLGGIGLFIFGIWPIRKQLLPLSMRKNN